MVNSFPIIAEDLQLNHKVNILKKVDKIINIIKVVVGLKLDILFKKLISKRLIALLFPET